MSRFSRRSVALLMCAGASSVAMAALDGGTASGKSTKAATAASSATVASAAASSGSTLKSCKKPGGGKYTFTLIPGDTVDPFYITMHQGAAAEAKRLGVTLSYQGGSAFDPSVQLPIMNTVFVQHPDALLWVPNDQKALDAAAQKFVHAKIPIITVDNFITDKALYKSQVLSKDYQGGQLAADRLGQLSHGKGQVAIEDSVAGNSLTDQRSGGFISELKKKFPHMQVVAHEYDNNSATTASAQTRSILLAHPNLVGIFATSDASGEGAGNATGSLHRKVPIVSYDASPVEVKLLKSKVLDSLIMQPPAEEGRIAVDTACEVLAGKSVPKTIQLDNVIATQQNYRKKSVSRYFYSAG